MKVRLLTDLIGPQQRSYKGDEIDVSKETAERLIDKGIAEKTRGRRGKSDSVGNSTSASESGEQSTD